MPNKIIFDDLNNLIEKIRVASDTRKSIETEPIFTRVEELIKQFSDLKSMDEIEVLGKLLSVLSTNPIRHKFAAYIDPGIFKKFGKKLEATHPADIIPAYLDIFRSPDFLIRIYGKKEWPELILNLLEADNYTFPRMFFHRAVKYKTKTLFTILESEKSIDYSWTKITRLVTSYARGLLALLGGPLSDSKIAFWVEMRKCQILIWTHLI